MPCQALARILVGFFQKPHYLRCGCQMGPVGRWLLATMINVRMGVVRSSMDREERVASMGFRKIFEGWKGLGWSNGFRYLRFVLNCTFYLNKGCPIKLANK